MRKNWLLIAAVVLVVFGIIGFFLRDRFVGAQAGLLVETNPPAQVFVDGETQGTTPFKATRKAGEITLRLIPTPGPTPLSTWETKLTLTAGIETVIRRDFGETEANSSGEILSFEKISGNLSSMSIVSSPDSAQVTLDGQIRGFTPVRIDSITPGQHQLVVTRPGFAERMLVPLAAAGYKLTAIVMLAQTEEPVATESASLTRTQIEILTTPTGFLRVRSEPRTSATESARVTPGQKYTLVEENEDGSWLKIEYEGGKEGWISAQYAKKVEEETP